MPQIRVRAHASRSRIIRLFQVPQIDVKEERRVLRYASDGLNVKVGCLRKPD